MVRVHQAHGGAAQDLSVIKPSAVEHHLREAEIVEGGRNAAGAARIIGRRRGDVVQPDRLASSLGQSAAAEQTDPMFGFGMEKLWVSTIFSGLNRRASRNAP